MNRFTALSVCVVLLGVTAAACSSGDYEGEAADGEPVAQETLAGAQESEDPSYRTEEIDGITHHVNKPPTPSGKEDYPALRPSAPTGVTYEGEVSSIVTAEAPKQGDSVATSELKLGWLARDGRGCAWYVDLEGRKHPLLGLAGSRVDEGALTFAGEFGEVTVNVGEPIAGGGQFVDVPVAGERCYGTGGSGFLASPYPN